MLSILKVALANIRKRKGQNILIGLILLSVSLIFSTSIIILNSLNKPFENMFENQKGSHLTMMFSNRIHNVQESADWWESQKEIEGVQVLNQHWLKDEVYFKGKEITSMLLITEAPSEVQDQDKLIIVEGEKSEKPGPGEVWLTAAFADNNDIKVGDILDIPTGDGTVPLKVSALVVDPCYSSSFINPTRVWTAPGQIALMYPLSYLDNVSMGIRFGNYSKAPELWSKYQDFLGQPYIGLKMDYETIYSANLFSYQMIGNILFFLSIIILFIALFILYFTITNSILSDYKTIGILKSQGFSSVNVISIFSIQYLFISLIVIPVGILLSKFSSHIILKSFVRALGIVSNNVSLLLPGAVTFVLLTLLILLVTWGTSIKINRIKPADAIRYGAPEKDHSKSMFISVTSLKKLPIPMILGIKDIISNKRQSLFLFMATAVTALVLTFSLNLNNSMAMMSENAAYWGQHNSDLSIVSAGRRFTLTREELMEKLQNEPNIDIIIPGSFLTNCSIMDDRTKTTKTIMGSVFDGDMDSIGMINLEGRHPKTENEVSLGLGTSRQLDKKPGDMVEIYIEGVKMNLLVTGVYQSMNNMGEGFRIQASAIKVANPTYEPQGYIVVLKDNSHIENYVSKLKSKLGTSVSVKISEEEIEKETRGIVANVAVMVFMIMFIFLLVCFITIFNFTSINIHHKKRNYGIYKSTGMTSKQIRLSILYRIIFITLLGLAIGIPAGILGAPKLLNLMFSSMGISKFPYSVSTYLTALVVPLCIAITGISAWIPSKRILNLNPRMLIVE